jgi:integrase
VRTEQRREFTATWLDAVDRAPAGKRVVWWDVREPGLGVRVTDKGVVSFFVLKRIAGSKTPTRITLGRYPTLGLADARRAAAGKLEVIERGKDPREEEARLQAAQRAQRAATFAALAERYKTEHLVDLRRGDDRWRDIERHLLPHWADKPLREITRPAVKTRLAAVRASAGPYARNRTLALIRTMLNFALDDELIEANPAARIDALEERRRQHALTDPEVVEVWNAVDGLAPNICALFRLLILTGQRRGEVAGMRWAELDPDTGLWTVSERRMKAGLTHEVPLPPQALGIITAVPRMAGSPFVFPGRFGAKPIVNFDLSKARLDEILGPKVRPWRIHDLRRTMRSGLSRLKIPYEVAERVVARITGSKVSQTYNVWDYRAEKAEALKAWAQHVERITNPQPNVVELRR